MTSPASVVNELPLGHVVPDIFTPTLDHSDPGPCDCGANGDFAYCLCRCECGCFLTPDNSFGYSVTRFAMTFSVAASAAATVLKYWLLRTFAVVFATDHFRRPPSTRNVAVDMIITSRIECPACNLDHLWMVVFINI